MNQTFPKNFLAAILIPAAFASCGLVIHRWPSNAKAPQVSHRVLTSTEVVRQRELLNRAIARHWKDELVGKPAEQYDELLGLADTTTTWEQYSLYEFRDRSGTIEGLTRGLTIRVHRDGECPKIDYASQPVVVP